MNSGIQLQPIKNHCVSLLLIVNEPINTKEQRYKILIPVQTRQCCKSENTNQNCESCMTLNLL